jgi:hypothetical protein
LRCNFLAASDVLLHSVLSSNVSLVEGVENPAFFAWHVVKEKQF